MSSERDEQLFLLLKELCELPGPTGHEDAVQESVAARWGTFAEVRRTRVGNVLAKVGGSGRRVALVAHADEICLMVKSISDDGYLHVWHYASDLLGKPPRWLMPLNQPAAVVTAAGIVDGVIVAASGHVVGRKDPGEPWKWNDWFVDVGVRSREAAEALGIHPGCRIVWNTPTRRVGQNIVGKAMDDRGALTIATLAGERLAESASLGCELWLASTVQEENGLIGASSLADELDLDQAIALDVGLTGDVPGADPLDFPCRLGLGPTVVYQDSSCHYGRRLSDELVATAREHSVPVQRAVYQNYGSDGAALVRRGIETALVAYPTRYTHSPVETVDGNDLLATVDLLVAWAERQR